MRICFDICFHDHNLRKRLKIVNMLSFRLIIIFTYNNNNIVFTIFEKKSKSLIVQNFIQCLILNFEIERFSKNVTNYLWDVSTKFLKLSKFYFTLLPTTDFLLMQKNSSRGNLFRGISILTSHLISAISVCQKFACSIIE